MTSHALGVAHERNNRKKSFTFLWGAMTATLTALFLTIPVAAQSPGTQDQKPGQPQSTGEPDLINPDRPGLADGSSVIGPKRFQIESGIQEEFRRNGDTVEHTFFLPTLLRLGINSHWEARIEGNTFTRITNFDSANITGQTSGFAPVSLGFKYHIYDSKAEHQTSLGTIVRVFPTWGSYDFRTQHMTGDLRLAADWNFAPSLKLSLNPNVGVGRYEDDQGKLFTAGLFAVTLNYLPTKKLNPFFDVGVQVPEETDGESFAIIDTGVAYIIGRNVQLDASIGTGAHGNTPPHPFVGFGISFRSKSFDRERRHHR